MLKKIGVLLLVFFLIGCAVQEETTKEVVDKTEVKIMKLTSSAFENDGKIPSQYTCDEENINPQLTISDVPENTKSLVLIMDDPDIPEEIKESRGIQVFDHWVMWNIPPGTTTIEAASIPEGAVQGANGRGDSKYTGPCPPPQYQPTEHRYFFKIYALDIELDLPEGSSKANVEQAMGGHTLGHAELVGRYDRS